MADEGGAVKQGDLLDALGQRFNRNLHRHPGIDWLAVQARLQAKPQTLLCLEHMEATGGEPDVIGVDEQTGEFTFCDCSPESPAGRRSLCFDRAALDARKENKPGGSVAEIAATLGVELLTEQQYRELQALGEFDKKTSSWIATPPEIRTLGGALFCDRRYGQIFTYHNGAESYYAARGFRGRLRV